MSVYYADVKFIVGTLFGLWFFLTPVLYSISGFLRREGMEGETNWLSSLIGSALPTLKQIYLADPVTIGILGYRSGLLNGGQNPLIVVPGKDLSVEAAQAAQAQLQAQYPMGHYILAAVVIALVTALLGHLIYNRLARQFAERG